MKNAFVFLLFLIIVQETVSIKVCATISDYSKEDGNCWDNPDGESNATQILQRWGATVTETYLTTDDGYILLMLTVVFNKTQATPIVVGHGQHHNCNAFIGNYNKSLIYHLLLEGYEVNLLNYRSSRYSRGHVNISFTDDKYWDFSFHEMGIYDLRKFLSVIYEKHNKPSIYIGFTMGTTVGYVYSSVFSDEAATYMKGMISLGPLATMHDIRSVANWPLMLWPIPLRPISKLIFGHYIPRVDFISEFFAKTPFRWYLTELFYRGPLTGFEYGQKDPLYKPVQAVLFEDIIPLNLGDHFADIYKAKKFVQRDFGEKNKQIYGSETPPIYDLSKNKVPVAMFLGKNDYFGDPAAAIHIYENLTQSQCGYTFINREKWNLGDFIWARDMVPLLVEPVMDKIKDIESGKC